MKTKLLLSIAIIFISFQAYSQFGILVSSQNICFTGSNTLAAFPMNPPGGAASYSWAVISSTCPATYSTVGVNGATVHPTFTCCGIYTITCSAYSINSVFIQSVGITVTLVCGPPIISITNSAPSGACLGNTVVLTATSPAAPNYTWSGGITNGVPFVPSVTACYSVAAQNACSIQTAVTCVTVIPLPTISFVGNTNICTGSTTTITPAGAVMYTLQPGSLTGTSFQLSPIVSTSYTITGANASGCSNSTVVNILVSTTPTVVSSGTTIPCGNSATLSASGANTYTWSVGANTQSIVVTPPTGVTCYTVVGSINNCSASTVVCVFVQGLPLNVSGSYSVCLGSSETLTVSGANSYTWFPGNVNTTTYNVLPLAFSVYTVFGLATNGCWNQYTVSVYPDPNCAIVWPGDANRDGVANNTDVLELGLAANSTGPARTNTSIAWSGQLASAWNNTVSTGWNRCHADCNGDGVVNGTDAAAVTLNFSQTHSFRSSSSAGNDISLVPQNVVATAGVWNIADVMLGDASNNLSQVYGVAFDLNYDQNMLETNAVNLVYTASFLKGTNQTIEFGKTVFASGKIFAATVRTDQVSVNGNGKIGELWYKVKTGLPASSTIFLSATNAVMISHAGTKSVLGTAAPVNQVIAESQVGLDKVSATTQSVRIYPNPSNGQLNIITESKKQVTFTISDITGRLLVKGEFVQTKTIDVSLLDRGNYIISFELDGVISHKKFVRE